MASKPKPKPKPKTRTRTKTSGAKMPGAKMPGVKFRGKAKVARPKARAKAKPARRPKAKPSAIPSGYNNVTPYLIVQDAERAIAFYKGVFGAKELMRLPMPGGRIGHAELKIGDSKIMLADEFPEMNARCPKTVGGTPVAIMLYVKNVDAVVDRAVAQGAKLMRAVKDQFYGDRSGSLEDPQGHVWHVATHVEDVSAKEMKRRMDAAGAEKS